jgi:hypothetical protein
MLGKKNQVFFWVLGLHVSMLGCLMDFYNVWGPKELLYSMGKTFMVKV